MRKERMVEKGKEEKRDREERVQSVRQLKFHVT